MKTMMSLSVGIHSQLIHIFIALNASDGSKDEPENVAYYEIVSVLRRRIAEEGGKDHSLHDLL